MKVLRKERYYDNPPEVVWVALTSPAALAEWLMPNNFRPELNATFELVTDPTPMCRSAKRYCRVLEFDPPRRMVWSWQHETEPGKRETPPMRITWTLRPEGAGTRLQLEQTGFEGNGWLLPLLMSIGWKMMLKHRIPLILANVRRAADGFAFTPGAIPLKKRFYRATTVPAAYFPTGTAE